MPTEEVIEVRRGQKVNAERKFLPGYVLLHAQADGRGLSPGEERGEGHGLPRPEQQADAAAPGAKSTASSTRCTEGAEHPKSTITFEIGEQVRVADGPFTSFTGMVEEVDEDRSRLKVAVSIFGRATPVELEFTQVEKV